MSNLSRAYRVNLSVLALVALFTGGFIVHSAIALAVTRERARLALLGVLGAGRGLLLRQVLGLALFPGLTGTLLGLPPSRWLNLEFEFGRVTHLTIGPLGPKLRSFNR